MQQKQEKLLSENKNLLKARTTTTSGGKTKSRKFMSLTQYQRSPGKKRFI